MKKIWLPYNCDACNDENGEFDIILVIEVMITIIK